VQEVLTAAGIPEDQNSTLGNWNLWDDAEWYCEQLCESKKEGEFCSEDNSCSVRIGDVTLFSLNIIACTELSFKLSARTIVL
jgi:hypothetical protein